MRRALAYRSVLLRGSLVLLLAGCAVELGAGAGIGGRAAPNHAPRFAMASGIATNLVWQPSAGRRDGVFLGGELQSRFEADRGSRWNTGLQLGYARLPERRLGAVGVEAHGDLGTRVRDGVLFPNGDAYVGATLAVPIWLFPRRQLADVNTDPWILSRAFELVPQLRGRAHLDGDDGALSSGAPRYDLSLGLALRTRFVSDLL